MKYTIKDIIKEFKHLRKFYKTKKEFEQHLLSGEVKISIPDMIELINKQQDKFALDFFNWCISKEVEDLMHDLIIVGVIDKNTTTEQLLEFFKNK